MNSISNSAGVFVVRDGGVNYYCSADSGVLMQLARRDVDAGFLEKPQRIFLMSAWKELIRFEHWVQLGSKRLVELNRLSLTFLIHESDIVSSMLDFFPEKGGLCMWPMLKNSLFVGFDNHGFHGAMDFKIRNRMRYLRLVDFV